VVRGEKRSCKAPERRDAAQEGTGRSPTPKIAPAGDKDYRRDRFRCVPPRIMKLYLAGLLRRGMDILKR
jgi:hypothetical protein